MGEGRVSLSPCADFHRPVEELEYTDLLRSTFTSMLTEIVVSQVYLLKVLIDALLVMPLVVRGDVSEVFDRHT
jgi:hypothetical protein